MHKCNKNATYFIKSRVQNYIIEPELLNLLPWVQRTPFLRILSQPLFLPFLFSSLFALALFGVQPGNARTAKDAKKGKGKVQRWSRTRNLPRDRTLFQKITFDSIFGRFEVQRELVKIGGPWWTGFTKLFLRTKQLCPKMTTLPF